MPSDYLKTFPHYIIPKHFLTYLAGMLANVQLPQVKNPLIRHFIQAYNVDMNEAYEENPENYASFNDFFIRHLKAECRPLANADILSPVDGSISELGLIKEGQVLQAKGHYYTVKELLANDPSSDQFETGSFATLYLSPKDYHRIHMPIDATLEKMIYVPGKLFSVQPRTVRNIPRLFARNERLIALFNTRVGLMAMVLVGATIVGAIGTHWHGDLKRSRDIQHFDYKNSTISLTQGEEMGYFKLGSTVILLFADQRVQWLENWHAGDLIRYGVPLAQLNK